MIVGLGNPGPQYRGTRHNVGFDVVEALAERHGIRLKEHKHQAQYGVGTIDGHGVVLCKPLTYMNLSGRAVATLAKSYGLKPDRIMVVSDDLDMALGRVRAKSKGSSGGHNGHKSIIQALQSEDYPRVKIGVGRSGESSSDHVLGKFKPDERATVSEALERAVKTCEMWLSDGIDQAMNWGNTN
ncbi:MAG: aminoacyl-tRNA hydrolase [Armatimonadetes bacterium]|nr:aminoacyl-tRNA hydrolase [Armatimonadota bacterium]